MSLFFVRRSSFAVDNMSCCSQLCSIFDVNQARARPPRGEQLAAAARDVGPLRPATARRAQVELFDSRIEQLLQRASDCTRIVLERGPPRVAEAHDPADEDS
jgi:hypothetical protein